MRFLKTKVLLRDFAFSFFEMKNLVHAQNYLIKIFENPNISPLKRDKI